MNLISIFFISVFTENIILFKFLGLCPFMGTSDNPKNAFNMGLSVLLVITLSSIIVYLINYLVLVPTKTSYLLTLISILVIASMVQALEIIIKKKMPHVYQKMGIYLPLITTNCAVLGVTLINVNNGYTFIQMLVNSIGSSIGFLLMIYVFSTIRERLDESIPASFKGIPIALIIAGMMSAIFSMYI